MKAEEAWRILDQMPHCDGYILHAPGECEFCDKRESWQALRIVWGIAFTGHSDEVNSKLPVKRDSPVLPCPADLTRPPNSPGDHRRWGGNTATTKRGDPSQPRQTLASVIMYGDQGGRVQWPLPERLLVGMRKPFERLKMKRRGYKREGPFWVYKDR